MLHVGEDGQAGQRAELHDKVAVVRMQMVFNVDVGSFVCRVHFRTCVWNCCRGIFGVICFTITTTILRIPRYLVYPRPRFRAKGGSFNLELVVRKY